jgi:hypothetical protein
MASYKDLNELVKKAVSWEKELKDLYDVAEIGLKEGESKKIVSVLRDNLVNKLEVLEHVDVEKYGMSEWLKYAPSHRDRDMLPRKAITKNSTPKEIFDQLLSFEEKLKDFYAAILESIRTENQKELFSSLVSFKEKQINEITRLMQNYNPVS